MDLRDAPTAGEVDFADSVIDAPLVDKQFELATGLKVSGQSYASAAWVVCQLFIRKRSAHRIDKKFSDYSKLIHELHETDARSVEELPIALRHKLTTIVHGLFIDWPYRLKEFCNRSDIAAEHLSQDRFNLPNWFDNFVAQHLRRQVRCISIEDVERICQQLVADGLPVLKARVQKSLKVSSAKSIDKLFGRRYCATDQELFQFVQRLIFWCDMAVSRKSSTETRLRDGLILMACVLCNAKPNEVAAWNEPIYMDFCDRLLVLEGDFSLDRIFCVSALQTLDIRYRDVRMPLGDKRKPHGGAPYFASFRGEGVPLRSVQKTLSVAMESLDSRLCRSVSVFWRKESERQMFLF